MSVTASFRTYALEQLGRVTPCVRSRPMFGGVGIYAGDLFFALLDDDLLYLKVDDVTRPEFEAAGMTPFLPFGDPSQPMGYYLVAAEVLEDVEALRPWTELALGAAERKRRRKRR